MNALVDEWIKKAEGDRLTAKRGSSDISQVFKVDDILNLSEDITASERRGLEEKKVFFPRLGVDFSYRNLNFMYWILIRLPT
jgi:hypothetical protein